MKKLLPVLLAAAASVLVSGCASDWDYFWNGPQDGSVHTPAYQHSSSYSAPALAPSYSTVESQDQKMRNYGQQLDRKINREIW